MSERLATNRQEMQGKNSKQIFKSLQELLDPMCATDIELRCKIVDIMLEYGFTIAAETRNDLPNLSGYKL